MRLIISFIIIFSPFVAFSQEEATFYMEFENESVKEALLSIEEAYDVRFSYQDSSLEDKYVSLQRKSRTLNEILNDISLQVNLEFNVVDKRYVIVAPIPKEQKIYSVQLDKVILNGYLTKGISKNKDASFQIAPKGLGILAGLTEPDVLESIQQLPGVVSPNETASGLIVRGGSSDQNRMIWDGINMYHKGHLFGMISPFNPNVTKSVTFINKGTHPRFGERTSSVIDMESNAEVSKSLKGEFGVSGVSADVLLEVPIIKDKLSIQGALRRSYTELYQSYTIDQLTKKVFQSTKIETIDNANNAFDFMDYNLRLNYKLNDVNSFYLSTISINNNLDYLMVNNENTKSFNDVLSIENSGYGLGWNTEWSSKTKQTTKAYFSEYRLSYNFIMEEGNEQTSDFDKRNVIFDSGISTEVEIDSYEDNLITLGYQYVLKDVSYAFLNTTNLSFILDSDQNLIETHNAYGNFDYKNSKWFDVSLGLRANYFKSLNAFKLEPRLLIYKPIFNNMKLQASWEMKHQIIHEIDETVLSDLALENRLWRLANGDTFPIIDSNQLSVGFIYNFKGWSIDLDHYYKKINNITALSLGFLNPVNSGVNTGEQKIIGLDFFLKKEWNSLGAWLSYSFNDSKSKYERLNNNKYFRSNTNVKHAFSTSVSYKSSQFQMALGWKWQTGKPYTGGTQIGNGFEFDEEINSKRLPNYHRLDFSSTYNFNFSKENSLKGKIGFSIRNIYNKKNFISREYFGNNDLNDEIRVVDKYSLGMTPNVLFRLYW